MGCNFQISGHQPDPEIRNRCLEFLKKFCEAKPAIFSPWGHLEYATFVGDDAKPEAKRGKSHAITGLSDPVYAETPLKRIVPRNSGKTLEAFFREYASHALPAVWSPEAFSGLFVDDFPIIFDNNASGTLCSFHRQEKVVTEDSFSYELVPDWLVNSEERTACAEILLLPICLTRFSTGYPFYYIMAEVLKKRFIPDLYISASFDVDSYEYRLYRCGYMTLFDKVPEDDLPELAVEAAIQTGMIYYWNGDTHERLREINDKRLKKIEDFNFNEIRETAKRFLKPKNIIKGNKKL
jgi:hypothetical protein